MTESGSTNPNEPTDRPHEAWRGPDGRPPEPPDERSVWARPCTPGHDPSPAAAPGSPPSHPVPPPGEDVRGGGSGWATPGWQTGVPTGPARSHVPPPPPPPPGQPPVGSGPPSYQGPPAGPGPSPQGRPVSPQQPVGPPQGPPAGPAPAAPGTTPTFHVAQPPPDPEGGEPDEPRTPPQKPPPAPSSATSQQLPVPMPPVTRPPAGSAYGYPARYSDAPGSGRFQLALPQLGTIVAGPAVGSLIAGIAAVIVAIGVACGGLILETMIAVAVTVLAVFFSGTAILLALLAFRQIGRGGGEYRGRGMAIAGLSCGCVGIGLALLLAFVVFAMN